MAPYIFAAAAVIAVIGIIIVFKINLDKIKENPNLMEKAQTNFFIGVAISESLPLILIIYAFINIQEEPVPVDELYIPALIVIMMMVFAAFFIFLQQKVDVEEGQKQQVISFSMIALALANSIPIIALVMMFMNIA
ncbi:hypothetical protein [Oceanobacillus massiliensis]|uniref:hypothetical protein n=1 Tax=Oceanobacillus massiliensis TaxID=1465765 RepID=UPI0002881D9F|nr:hypothetical protein [Oceanobacillus massiliensis]